MRVRDRFPVRGELGRIHEKDPWRRYETSRSSHDHEAVHFGLFQPLKKSFRGVCQHGPDPF